MAKPQKSKKPDLAEIELHPDAWQRFENFVKTNVPTKVAVPVKTKAPKAKASKSK